MRSVGIWVGVGAAVVLLALAWTLPYGAVNQATYLLDPLHRAMPDLFHRDWFVHETPPYLPVFGQLARWLYVADSEGASAFIVAHIAVNLASYAALYWLVAPLRGGWCAFLLVASFATLTKNLSMGGSYLFGGYLQPNALATLGWLVAIAALVRDRFLLCGIAAAIAGVVHANFLVLGVGLFGLATLARGDVTRRDLAKVLAPQLVVLACFVPQLASAAGPSDHALWILTRFHAPVHYSPDRLVGWIKSVAAWQLGAFAALRLVHDLKPMRVLWRFSLIASAIVIAGALVVRFTPFESLVQLNASRIAPFAQLACQAIMATALVRHAFAPRELATRTRVLVGLGLIVPLYVTGYHIRLMMPWLVIHVGALAIVLVLVPWRHVARVAVAGLALACFACALYRSPRAPVLRSASAASDTERELSQWVREHTETDALFLAPPHLGRFRLLARRAVVADSKSPPLHPVLLVEWYERLCDIVHFPNAPTHEAIEARYSRLFPAELEDAARRYGADYIVVASNAPLATPPVYENREFRVYRATGAPAATR